MKTIAALLFIGIYAPAQYGGGFPPGGVYGPYGPPGPGAYDAPPCNPRHNPDCGRFDWEGPRSRQFRCSQHPMMPDCPRGPGYGYEGRPPPFNPDDWDE